MRHTGETLPQPKAAERSAGPLRARRDRRRTLLGGGRLPCGGASPGVRLRHCDQCRCAAAIGKESERRRTVHDCTVRPLELKATGKDGTA